MSDKKYWIWLSQALGPGARIDEVLGAFPEPEKLYYADEAERMTAGVFTAKQLERLGRAKLSDAETAIRVCARNGWEICVPQDESYPEELKKLTDMPLVLYVDGDISRIKDKISIGIVGTRQPSYESACIARTVAGDLASAGAAVISGGALGIDSAAHEGAVAAGGVTVCVMGCGLGCDYLRENEPLRRQIRETGALVSEFTPLASASRTTFPIRNRIISGMSHGVLVVEAGEKSGSLITAKRANEQGREVFGIPGSVLASAYTGVNNLIKDGARAVTSAADILAPYAAMYPDRVDITRIRVTKPDTEPPKRAKPVKIKKEPPSALDREALTVYNLFGEEPLHPDDIAAQSGLSPSKVLSILMRLELLGLIEQTDGRNYILK